MLDGGDGKMSVWCWGASPALLAVGMMGTGVLVLGYCVRR